MNYRFLTTIVACAFALAFSPPPAQAQTQPTQPAAPVAAPLADADPALWVVRDEDTTIYLFGTFHLLDGRPWFNDEVKIAFDASDELVVEVLLPEDQAAQIQLMQPLIIRYAIDQNGRTISSRLTAEQNARLNSVLARLGAPANAFDMFEPWFVMLTLTNAAAQQLGLNPQLGPETILRRAATERNIAQGELETIESQLQIFDNIPEEDQLRGLREVLDDTDQLQAKLGPMLEAWSTGDVERLATLMNESLVDDPALYDAIFTNRNANWARWIQERLARPGTVFMAVGAGHLAGRGSVQEQLRALDISSERVPHVEAN